MKSHCVEDKKKKADTIRYDREFDVGEEIGIREKARRDGI